MNEALQLLRWEESTGLCRVNSDAVRILEGIQEPITVIAIIGIVLHLNYNKINGV